MNDRRRPIVLTQSIATQIPLRNQRNLRLAFSSVDAVRPATRSRNRVPTRLKALLRRVMRSRATID
jgi:hypothetical protein